MPCSCDKPQTNVKHAGARTREHTKTRGKRQANRGETIILSTRRVGGIRGCPGAKQPHRNMAILKAHHPIHSSNKQLCHPSHNVESVSAAPIPFENSRKTLCGTTLLRGNYCGETHFYTPTCRNKARQNLPPLFLFFTSSVALLSVISRPLKSNRVVAAVHSAPRVLATVCDGRFSNKNTAH